MILRFKYSVACITYFVHNLLAVEDKLLDSLILYSELSKILWLLVFMYSSFL